MPIANTGVVSIGGSTSSNSVNLQLSRAVGAATSLSEVVTRNLAVKPSGPYSFSDFLGKGIVGNGIVQGVNARWSVNSSVGTEAGPVTAAATVNLSTDGTGNIQVSGAGTVGSPGWYTAAVSGVGNSYWVRATMTDSGSSLVGNATAADSFIGTFGTWEPLSTARQWRVQRTLTRTGTGLVTSSLYRTITFEFAGGASGLPLIATHTGNIILSTPQLNAEAGAFTTGAYEVSRSTLLPTACANRISLGSTGTIVDNGTGSVDIRTGTQSWWTPTTASISSSKYVRFTAVSGTGTDSGLVTPLNTWRLVSAQPAFGITRSTSGSDSKTYTADFSNDGVTATITGRTFTVVVNVDV